MVDEMPPTPPDQLFLALSHDAVSSSKGSRTMKLQGSIQGYPLLILVDSGSSHTFLSQKVADQLVGVMSLMDPITIQVANGNVLQCSSHIPSGTWITRNCSFTSNLKVLPLHHYDLILGMDWLECFSPMKVHWKLKWMAIPYQNSTVVLNGISSPILPDEVVVQVCSLAAHKNIEALHSEIPAEIVAILKQFDHVFEPISGMPPVRSCDHVIPLVSGAKPVYIRPYRYPPALKDGIEKQVQEMLDKSLIQPSASPFSSSLLLVKKKDGIWRPCVDYRHLNAPTVRGKFPIPVFDELVDELAGASWFSSLDLNSGFHQIRMKKGEEHKTAFQTHFGHFEFE